MDQSLYSQSLQIALPLMLFFGCHMLLSRTPDKKVFCNYLLSRRLMGAALLILAANYSVHLFTAIRLRNVNATILMNLSTYFLCYWLFYSAMMILLDKRHVTLGRFLRHLALWVAFSVSTCVVLFLFDNVLVQVWCMAALAAWLVGYGVFLSVHLLRTYSYAIKMFENTYSDDISQYIRWLSIFTYWAIGFGVSCGLLTFLPDKYIFIWILSSIPFYIYLYCCYQNYILFYEKVEKAFLKDVDMPKVSKAGDSVNANKGIPPSYYHEIGMRISEWIEKEGYRKPGISLIELSTLFCTNRTYISTYINTVYNMSFRDWISSLRIEYAKRLMKRHSDMKMNDISEMSGFASLNHFIRIFKAKEGSSPAKWREAEKITT